MCFFDYCELTIDCFFYSIGYCKSSLTAGDGGECRPCQQVWWSITIAAALLFMVGLFVSCCCCVCCAVGGVGAGKRKKHKKKIDENGVEEKEPDEEYISKKPMTKKEMLHAASRSYIEEIWDNVFPIPLGKKSELTKEMLDKGAKTPLTASLTR